MGYEKFSQKLTFYKAFFSPHQKFLIHTILQCLSAKTTAWNEFSSTMAYAITCLATNKKFNFSKYIFDNMVKHLDGGVKFMMYLRFFQVFLDNQVEGMDRHNAIFVISSHTKKVFANMKREGKGFYGVLNLEKAKTAQVVEISSLKIRDKKLERKKKSRTLGLKRLRKGRLNAEEMFGVNDLDGDEVIMDVTAGKNVEQSVKITENEVSTVDPVTTVGKVVTTAVEPERPLRRKDQIMMDADVAKNLEAQMQAKLEEEERLARLKEEKTNIALIESYDNTQAMMDADCELAARLQEEKRGELSIKEKSRLFVEFMDKRKKHFARLRAKKIRSKLLNKAQKRNQMSFVPMDTELVKGSEKEVEGSEKAEEGGSKRAGSNLEQEDAKR
nr:hypothetical protein [Tanacetum cinerariifolium]